MLKPSAQCELNRFVCVLLDEDHGDMPGNLTDVIDHEEGTGTSSSFLKLNRAVVLLECISYSLFMIL